MHNNGSKRVLIIDADTETGREIACSLARDGFDIALVGRDSTVLSQTENVCSAYGGNVFSLEGDGPSRPPSKVVAEAVELLGGLDVLVNRPGLICPMLAARTTLDDWTLLADANLTSAGQFSLSALPWLARSPNATSIDLLRE
jgi:NAD(P)-dependent dehydrogenase (short-subunit alcohol dehydrogenase family)